jgi:hypothetical protein
MVTTIGVRILTGDGEVYSSDAVIYGIISGYF